MCSNFMGAALPWIIIALFVAIACSFMSNKKN